MALEMWGDVLLRSFQDLGFGLVAFLPKVLLAIIIFLAGWVVGSLIARAIARVIDMLRVDEVLQGAGIGVLVSRAGFRLNSGKFLGLLVEWFVIVSFLIASFDVLGLVQVNIFLQQVVLLYLPQVIVAILVLLVAGVVAETMKEVVGGAARAAGVSSANFLAGVTKWSIWIFAILTALYQLGVAAPFVQTLFTGFVVAISIAVGLAFGLGGQDAAAKLIDRTRKELADK